MFYHTFLSPPGIDRLIPLRTRLIIVIKAIAVFSSTPLKPPDQQPPLPIPGGKFKFAPWDFCLRSFVERQIMIFIRLSAIGKCQRPLIVRTLQATISSCRLSIPETRKPCEVRFRDARGFMRMIEVARSGS